MNTEQPPHQNSPPPSRKGRKRLFWGLVFLVSVILAFGFFLGTPAGQRRLVESALGLAESSLAKQTGSVDLGLEGVSIQWSPLGISLEGLQAFPGSEGADARPRDTLAFIDELTLLPSDASGLHWLNLKASGVFLSAPGQAWLEQWIQSSPGGSASSIDFRVDHLELQDIRLPEQHSDVGSHALEVESLHCHGLIIQGEDVKWDAMEGQLELRSIGRDSVRQDVSHLHWQGADRHLAFDLSTDPAFWLDEPESDGSPTALIPSHWMGEWNVDDGELLWRGSGDFSTLHGKIAWRGDTLFLPEAEWNYHGLSMVPEGLPPSGQAKLTGPLFLPLLSGDSTDGYLGALGGNLQLLWKPEFPHSDGFPDFPDGRVALSWGLGSGAAELDAHMHWDSTSAGAAHAGLVLNTTLPRPEQWTVGAWKEALTFEGSWNIERPGDAGGTGRAEGTLSLTAGMDAANAWNFSWDWEGRSAPLTLTPGLELFGQWSGAGAAALPEGGNLPSDWWWSTELQEARFIPLAGYDGRQQAGPPLAMRRLRVGLRGDTEQLTADLEGDFVEGHIEGPLDAAAWWNPCVGLLAAGDLVTDSTMAAWKLPSSPPERASSPWNTEVIVWRDDLLERFSHNQWSVGPGSKIKVHHADGDVQLEVSADHLHWGTIRSEGVRLEAKGGLSSLSLAAGAGAISHAQYGRLEELQISTEVALNDHSIVRAEWKGATPTRIEVEHYLREGSQHIAIPKMLICEYEETKWWIDEAQVAPIAWRGADWRTLTTPGLHISGNRGGIRLASALSSGADSSVALEVQLDAFPAGPWLDLLSRSASAGLTDLEAKGLLHGTLRLNPSTGNHRGSLQWIDASLNGYSLGDLCAEGAWGSPHGLALQQFRGADEILRAQTTDLKRLDLVLKEWPLDQLNPLLGSATVRTEGSATGQLTLVGIDNGSRALLNGNLDIEADRLYIGATGVTYSLDGRLDISPDFLGMDRARIKDPEGHVALLNLSVFHSEFSDWSYDIGLELSEPLSVMDLGADPGRLYHGQVLAVGEANVFGTTEYMEVEAKAQSAGGTRFTMPLDALEGAEIPAGISFVGGDTTDDVAEFPAAAFDVDLRLELEVTPEAELSLVLDQKAGERVDGRASGSLSLVRSRNRSLGMEGALVIEEGQYRFSLRDLFSKNISIAPGGRIDWDGDPYEAELSLLAVAPMKTNPSPLIPNMVERGKTEVEVGMGIQGALSAPQLDFSIDFPQYAQSDPAMLAQVNAALSTPEEVERQAFALLATGQFLRLDQNNVQSIGAAAAAAQASDLVSAGVSELLSSLSDDVDIGLRYVPPSELGSVEGATPLRSEDTFEMDLGLNLLNDRLKISGTFGAQGVEGFDVGSGDLQGTFDVRYQLTPDGRWELMGYRKPQSTLDKDPRNGFGAVFQKRFDQISDLFRKKDSEENLQD